MSTIQLEIVTPERKVYSDDIEALSTRTLEGEIGILPRHSPLVGPLQITSLRIKKNGEEKRIAVSGGFLEVRPEKITILAETAEFPEEINVERAKQAQERAEKRIQQQEGDIKRAEIALQRAVNRIQVAEWKP